MEHIDEAQVHEFLDRGAVDDRLKELAEHVGTCEQCTALLKDAQVQRAAAAAILRATTPVHLSAPAFDSLLPRPTFDTFDATHASDISMPNQLGNFKQSSIGMRGQAVAFAWVAIVVLIIAGGVAFGVIYHENERAHTGPSQDQALLSAATAAAVSFNGPASNWRAIPEDSAISLLSDHIVSVRAASAGAYSVGEFGGVTYVRTQQTMASHDTIDVIQSATPLQQDGAPADSMMPPFSLRVSGPWQSIMSDDRRGYFDAFAAGGRSVMVIGRNEDAVRHAELFVRGHG